MDCGSRARVASEEGEREREERDVGGGGNRALTTCNTHSMMHTEKECAFVVTRWQRCTQNQSTHAKRAVPMRVPWGRKSRPPFLHRQDFYLANVKTNAQNNNSNSKNDDDTNAQKRTCSTHPRSRTKLFRGRHTAAAQSHILNTTRTNTAPNSTPDAASAQAASPWQPPPPHGCRPRLAPAPSARGASSRSTGGRVDRPRTTAAPEAPTTAAPTPLPAAH